MDLCAKPQKQFTNMEEGLTAPARVDRSMERRVKLLSIALIVSMLLSVACLAAVIAIGVEQSKQKGRVDDLDASVEAASTGSSASRFSSLSSSSESKSSTSSPSGKDSDDEESHDSAEHEKAEDPEEEAAEGYDEEMVEVLADQGALLIDSPKIKEKGFKLGGYLYEGSGYWTRLADMIYQRSDHSVIPVGDMVYIIGGVTDVKSKETVLDTVTTYHTMTNTMIALKDMPLPRFRFAAAELDGNIYVAGGYTELPTDKSPDNKVDFVDVYNIKTNKWSKGKPLATARSDACAAVLDGKLYVLGGWDAKWNVLSSMEVFDPETGKWSTGTDMLSPRGDLGCAVVDGKLYTVGGFSNSSYVGSLEVYDPKTDQWTLLSPMKHPRGDFGIVGISGELSGGKLLILGGEIETTAKNASNKDAKMTKIASFRVEQYIVEHDTWVELAPLPEARFRTAAAVAEDHVYVFGGNPTCEPDKNLPACYQIGLKSVFAYFDVDRPSLYIALRDGTRKAHGTNYDGR